MNTTEFSILSRTAIVMLTCALAASSGLGCSSEFDGQNEEQKKSVSVDLEIISPESQTEDVD